MAGRTKSFLKPVKAAKYEKPSGKKVDANLEKRVTHKKK
jgi:hypothetical protein